MSDTGSGEKVFLAFALGALAGATIALLFAPAEGSETREKLGQKAREGRDRASEALRQGREAFERKRDRFSTTFERGAETPGPDEQEHA